MILDDLLALFGGIIGVLLAPFVWVANVLLAGAELMVRLVFHGFTLPRISGGDSESGDDKEHRKIKLQLGRVLAVATIVVMLCLLPLILWRPVSFVASDGHAVPFAEVVIEKGEEVVHKRTDSVGNVSIPRFGVTAVTIKSARYVEQTWRGEEIQGRLVVRRTILGSGIDKVARALLAPAEK